MKDGDLTVSVLSAARADCHLIQSLFKICVSTVTYLCLLFIQQISTESTKSKHVKNQKVQQVLIENSNLFFVWFYFAWPSSMFTWKESLGQFLLKDPTPARNVSIYPLFLGVQVRSLYFCLLNPPGIVVLLLIIWVLL